SLSLKIFKLIRLGRPWFLPPGFCIRGTLEFSPVTEKEEVKDSIRICIDEEEILEVPVTGLPRFPSFIMDSLLDFGCLVAGSQVVNKMHPILNNGSTPAEGRFKVKYERSESFSLKFLPSHGIIEAGTTLWLTAELRVDRPGLIAEEALVMLQDCPDVVLRIQAEVVEQHLEVSDVQGFPLPCLWFGPVYFGAFSEKKVLLRNNSPISCDWVCLLMDKTAGIEAGTDLQKSTGTTLLERMKNCSSTRHSAFQVLECVPAHGRLSPYNTTTVAVRFSPKPRRIDLLGWRSTSPGRQDYCLFLLFDIVSCKHGFTQPTGTPTGWLKLTHSICVEVAVTGSGIPVALVPSPSDTFDFSHCAMGRHSDLLCVLQNHCPQLPIRFRFRKLAHFTAHPPTGTIAPGQYQDVVLTFNARQQGTFHVRQKVEVLGWVASQKDGSSNEVGCFHTILLHLSAICDSVRIPPQPKLHSETEMTSCVAAALKCPIGLRPCVRLKELDHCSMLGRIAAAKLHKHSREMRPVTDIDEFLAFPNDRPASIRPVSPHAQYRTIFTGVRRHNYVDPTYAFTKEEEELRQRNQQIYMNFIKQLHQRRYAKTGERQPQTGDDDVLEIDTHNGLVPPEFSITNLNSTKNSDVNPSYSSKHFCEITNSGDNQIFEAVNTVPSTRQQVADCRRTLNPLEFYHVDITPSSVNFGRVALHSVCATNVHLVNRLPVHIWVELEVDCVELQGSSMLSQVLPPFFHSIVPLTFQSTVLGHFKSSLSYTINQQHPGQILILAEVVPLTLELSSNLLVLTPNPVLLAGSEYRGIVTLRNMSNCVAEFTWKPVIPESGLLLYSIRPATGVVEPHMEIDCEINWHPGFNSPTEGDFDLFVQEGTCQHRLHCVAKIAMKNMKSIKLRIGGSVEPPNVTFSKLYFQFCGVHTGSQQRIPFSITNHSAALSQVTFDLSKYKEFSVKGRSPSTMMFYPIYIWSWEELSHTEECFLVFSPTQVISYDFVLPVMVNGVKWPTSLPSFFTSSSSATLLLTPDSRKTMTTSTTLATDEQQSIALFAPVEMSSTRLQFVVVSHSPTFPQKAQGEQSICWKAVEGEGIRWRFDLGAAAELCAVAPAFGFLRPGQSVCLAVTFLPPGERITKVSIPLYLGEEGRESRKLSVVIVLSRPSIVFCPRQILFTPVPLSKGTETKLTLHTAGYPCGTTISAECKEVETMDGTKIRPISVSFPDGNRIHVQNITEGTKVVSLLCEVSFCSDEPVSLCTAITFCDHMKNKNLQSLPSTFSSFLCAFSSSDSRLRSHVCGGCSPEVRDDFCVTVRDSDSLSYCQSMDEQAENHSAKSDTPASLSIPKFPVAKSEETKFYQKVLLTVEKWFSLYGWPCGTNPMCIPHSFRRVVFVVQTSDSNGRAFSVTQNKDTRSVVDMLEHLTGRMIPGIPMCQTFSKDIHQRTIQVLQQNEAILEFLRVQGACLCHIKPEYLLDIAEFKHWCSLQ
uniref:Cilia- and flagella-associated protein 47 domain-containing protein n=1 Tax=Poecilia formosa TaxID=48698 RepID=A0A087XDJ3_POEFO